MEASTTTRIPTGQLRCHGLVREMRKRVDWESWVDGEKIVDGFARLQKVDECLHRNSSICKAGNTVHDLLSMVTPHALLCSVLVTDFMIRAPQPHWADPCQVHRNLYP